MQTARLEQHKPFVTADGSEEIYLFTAGAGRMRLDGDEALVRAGHAPHGRLS